MKTIFVEIPYFDEHGMKQRITLTLDAKIDRRRMYRGIRQIAKQCFNKTVGKEWIKQNCTIIYDCKDVSYEPEQPKLSQNALDELYLKLMAETEEEELKNDSNSTQ